VKPFHGIVTPLVTPLNDDESPDLESLIKLVDWQIGEGVQGFWAMGTSGEFASFDEAERGSIVETTVKASAGRAPVIANVSDASTRLSIRHGKAAQAAGAAAIAATPPYYYPHSQGELLSHYRRIRHAVDLPLFIYNIPQTVRVKVKLSTAETLALDGTVSGIKDSQNDLEWLRQLAIFVRTRELDFTIFAGTRHLIDAAVLSGADGAIPSIANAFPSLCTAVYHAATAGNFAEARRRQTTIVDIETAAATDGKGSKNAVVLSGLKRLLVERGILSRALLTSPLRDTSDEEWLQVSKRVCQAQEADIGYARGTGREIDAPH
jgi:4-hydroxy-tetrahydrodipicolinate synthase